MASRKKSGDYSRSMLKNERHHAKDKTNASSSSDEDERTVRIRNCSELLRENLNINRERINSQPANSEFNRREENPFSFKHFLKNDSQMNYNTGARPKVYCTPTSSPINLDLDAGVYSRNPTELPDFVQDHLVIEQCYLNHDTKPMSVPDIDNLPDFALNPVEMRKRYNDLKCPSASLDLPSNYINAEVRVSEIHEHSGSDGENNITKSLPDFLSDGPIRNRNTPASDLGSGSNNLESLEGRLSAENARLRHELEQARRQLSEKSHRIQCLEADLASRKENEYKETANLEKAMEQVEDNLKRSTRRAVNAESTVTTLKMEIKALNTELSLLQAENKKLRVDLVSAGHNEYGSSNTDRTIRRLADDLRSAASTAEVSLRQLMSGVDNLRVLASALENVDRIEDRTKDFLPDFDEDNAAGPAL